MSWPRAVKQRVSLRHRTWLSCYKRSGQSGILMRNVFVRLASPRCRPHHTQQQAGQHRKHIKTAIWAPLPLNWIQGAMQHDWFAWTRTLKLFSITQLINVRQDHERSRTRLLSAQTDKESLSASVQFERLLLLQLQSRSARQPDSSWSPPRVSTDSYTCIKSTGKIWRFWHSFSVSGHLQGGRIRRKTFVLKNEIFHPQARKHTVGFPRK